MFFKLICGNISQYDLFLYLFLLLGNMRNFHLILFFLLLFCLNKFQLLGIVTNIECQKQLSRCHNFERLSLYLYWHKLGILYLQGYCIFREVYTPKARSLRTINLFIPETILFKGIWHNLTESVHLGTSHIPERGLDPQSYRLT